MQKVTREVLLAKAKELLQSNTVDSVLAWGKGEFSYDVTPTVFLNVNDLEENFVFGDFCGSNLSKYLVKEIPKTESKILVFLKPCDTYSFNLLLTEHRIEREKVYVVGIPCEGMLSPNKIRQSVESFTNAEMNGEKVNIYTLFNGAVELDAIKCLPDRCINCKSKRHVAYDELLGDEGEVLSNNRFDEVERIERMTPDERFAFWQNELSRCIRCNACRDVCPACTCEKCVFDNTDSGLENKAPSDSFEEKMFHIIRAFHVSGRCTDCGECSRVCPQQIPLHLLNRKIIKDINNFYGEYQAGETVKSRAPIVDFKLEDPEAADVVKGEND